VQALGPPGAAHGATAARPSSPPGRDAGTAARSRPCGSLRCRGAAAAPGNPDGVQPARGRSAICAATRCSGCSRTVRRTTRRTVRHQQALARNADPGRRRRQRVGRRVLYRSRHGVAADRGPAGQAYPGRRGGAGHWLGTKALGSWIGANVTGVRNPYAVLAARLSRGELPPPSVPRPARPPWCGDCDELTRILGFDRDAPRRCPLCHPHAPRVG